MNVRPVVCSAVVENDCGVWNSLNFKRLNLKLKFNDIVLVSGDLATNMQRRKWEQSVCGHTFLCKTF